MNRSRASSLVLFILSALLLAALPTSNAQDAAPSYQALVRFEDQYHLWDVATGELTLIPGLADVEWTRSSWSPDGAYLLVSPYGEDNCCSGLYDVERQKWDTRTFGREAVWSPTGNYIASTQFDEDSTELILFNWLTQTEYTLYTFETHGSDTEIREVAWSPDELTIFFVLAYDVSGGSANYAHLYYLPSDYIYTVGLELFNVTYNPIWSPNGQYLLLRLEIISPYTSFSLAQLDVGDIYLINAHTGERHRITNTPYEYEISYGWSEDGKSIQYSVFQTVEVSLSEAESMEDAISESVEISKLPLLEQRGFFLTSTSSDEQWQVWKDDNCVMISLNVETEASFQLGDSELDCQPTTFIDWRPLPPLNDAS